MTREEAADLLDLIVERAPQLREAGVLMVNLGGASFRLSPSAVPDEAGAAGEPEEEGPTDVLRDPWTHGRPGRDTPKSLTVKRTPL